MSVPACDPSSAPTDPPIRLSPSLHWTHERGWFHAEEPLIAERPLAIEIAYPRGGHEIRKVLAVTMRTPGHDADLALGFLFAEGLIASPDDIVASSAHSENVRGEIVSTQRVHLRHAPREDLQRVSRSLLTSSACGFCGRVSVEGLPTRSPTATEPLALSPEQLSRLPDALRATQPLFAETGGSHGAALVDLNGTVVLAREDVGRHNAVDKLLGAALRENLPAARHILVLSSRASFELLQKASAFGMSLVVAVGAPSSLAVSLAHEAEITLIGFARDGRFNVYTHAHRLALAPTARA